MHAIWRFGVLLHLRDSVLVHVDDGVLDPFHPEVALQQTTGQEDLHGQSHVVVVFVSTVDCLPEDIRVFGKCSSNQVYVKKIVNIILFQRCNILKRITHINCLIKPEILYSHVFQYTHIFLTILNLTMYLIVF